MNHLSKEALERLYGCSLNGLSTTFADATALHQQLKPRPYDAHKGTFGHALLIAGKRGMAGAALMASRSCMRSGVGLLTTHTASCNVPILQGQAPEVICSTDDSEETVSTLPDLSPYTAIAAGPGLGKDAATQTVLQTLFEQATAPLVLDADALNMIAANATVRSRLPKGSILTPHVKELQRLSGHTFAISDRLYEAIRWAKEKQIYLVLKGACTAIVCPDGHITFNPTGNAGMATAGSGDVLTGIILSLLAQGYTAQTAAEMGVYVHGLAGDLAAAKVGPVSLIATDIIDALPQAWMQLSALS